MTRCAKRPCCRCVAPIVLSTLLIGLTIWAPCGAAIEAGLSASDLAPGQAVTLTLTALPDTPAAGEPDLTPLLPDFHLLEQRRMQTSNGEGQQGHELILRLLPRRTGTLQVPPLVVGGEASPSLTLTVSQATAPHARLLRGPSADTLASNKDRGSAANQVSPKVEVSATITPSSGVIGQEFLMRIRATSTQGAPLGTFLTVIAESTRALPLGEWRGSDDSGNPWLEEHLAVFPERAGTIELGTIGFDAWNPAGGAPVRQLAKPMVIEVSPPAPDRPTDNWLPARDLTLVEGGPSQIRVAPGQPIERMVTLRADGLSAEQLPPLPLDVPAEILVAADPPRLWNESSADGIVGYRTERVVLMLAHDGQIQLPEIAIDWWDTELGAMRAASLPAWTLTAAPFASESRRAAATWNGTPTLPPGAIEDPPRPPSQTMPLPWPWLVLGAALLLAAGLLAMITGRARLRPEPASSGVPSGRPVTPGPPFQDAAGGTESFPEQAENGASSVTDSNAKPVDSA